MHPHPDAAEVTIAVKQRITRKRSPTVNIVRETFAAPRST
jgi:hypothetical protein